MKNRSVYFILALFSLICVSCHSQERVKGWEGDLDFYIQQVRQQHYVYSNTALPAAFDQKAVELRKNIPQFSDLQVLFEFEGLAALLGDGHTYVLPWGANKVDARGLPLRFYLFSDGLFIIDAPKEFTHLIGSRVMKFGNLSTEVALKKIAPYISRDNEIGIQWIGPTLLSLQGALEGIGVDIKNDKVNLTLTHSNGTLSEEQFTLITVAPMRGLPKLIPSRISAAPVPIYLQQVRTTYWIKSLRTKASRHLYVQFNQVMNDPNESLRSFSARLADSLTAIKPKKLILDVRHNNGGNADLLYPLLNVLGDFQKSNSSSSIIIITGRNTFSACQIFISRADELLHPVFAGERSSSKPNFVGEENNVILPYSGAICSISNRYHESIPGDKREWIEPQIVVLLSSGDYFSNRDAVLEELIKE